MPTRRTFVSLLGGTAAWAVTSTAAQPPAGAAAARTRRRIIWNNDGDDLRFVAFGRPKLWAAHVADKILLPERFTSARQFLDLRMSALREHPVDTISYCGVFNWPAWEMPRERIAAL